jgi:hypothetical protein
MCRFLLQGRGVSQANNRQEVSLVEEGSGTFLQKKQVILTHQKIELYCLFLTHMFLIQIGLGFYKKVSVFTPKLALVVEGMVSQYSPINPMHWFSWTWLSG